MLAFASFLIARYVRGFPQNFGEQELTKLFAEHGEIVSLKLMLDEDGKSRGFAFVCLKTSQEARNAQEVLHGK